MRLDSKICCKVVNEMFSQSTSMYRRGFWESLFSMFVYDGKRINKRHFKRQMMYAYGYVLDQLQRSRYFFLEGSSASAIKSHWLSQRDLPCIPVRTVMFVNFITYDPYTWKTYWRSMYSNEKYEPLVLNRPYVYKNTYFPGIRKGDLSLLVRIFCENHRTGNQSESCLALIPMLSLYYNDGSGFFEGCGNNQMCTIPGVVAKHVFDSQNLANESQLRRKSQEYECANFKLGNPSNCKGCGVVTPGWHNRFQETYKKLLMKETGNKTRFFHFFCKHADVSDRFQGCKSIILRKRVKENEIKFAIISDITVPAIERAWIQEVNGEWPSEKLMEELKASKFLNDNPEFVKIRDNLINEQNVCGEEFNAPMLEKILKNLFRKGYGCVEFFPQ